MPDGITVDSLGNVWVALWGGGAVRAYSPNGELLDVISLPVTQVTACTFGGPGAGGTVHHYLKGERSFGRSK
jgi:sugar lactone lactonase YvrE